MVGETKIDQVKRMLYFSEVMDDFNAFSVFWDIFIFSIMLYLQNISGKVPLSICFIYNFNVDFIGFCKW